jgi:apolipoprotein D and lipocalin family protein
MNQSEKQMRSFNAGMLMILILAVTACSTHKPMPAVEYVDLDRFMGDWFVIANIPTFLEKDAYNPVETYRLDDDGTIATTFTFNQGSLDGEKKNYHPRGFVQDSESNAIWGMQFIWPIKADYRIVYLDGDYQKTIIGRKSRDYVWIMARKSSISEKEYNSLVDQVGRLGYDIEQLRKAEHNPSADVEKDYFTGVSQVEYSTSSLSGFEKIVLTTKRFERSSSSRVATKGGLSTTDRVTRDRLLLDIDLSSLGDLPVPSKRHQFDGAQVASLKITTEHQVYASPSFDHDNPPVALRPLIDFILALE